jgi:hypothetical protein
MGVQIELQVLEGIHERSSTEDNVDGSQPQRSTVHTDEDDDLPTTTDSNKTKVCLW